MRKTIRVAILLAVMGVLAAPRGLVLCVGDTGHVSIEAALELVPCQPVSDDTRFESEPAETCNDMPLASAALKATDEREVVVTFFGFLAPPARISAISRRSPAPAYETHPSAENLWLREYRTIVLLV